MITHYKRLLDYVEPDYVHVLQDGRIIQSGDKTLAAELERRGYGTFADHLDGDDNNGSDSAPLPSPPAREQTAGV
jgi:Fe-S cluster assembly ATPase SufC